MIAKPMDWDSAQAYTGDGEKMTPGGHVVRIMAMRQEMSRNNKPMIVVAFDIEEGSELDGFYKRQHDARKGYNAAAKWTGVIRYMLYARDGMSTNGFFKGFIDAVEKSNPGYCWNWDERSLAGKKVGMIFGEEEYKDLQNGVVRVTVKAQQARSVQAVLDGVPVPPIKKLPMSDTNGYAPAASGFTQVEDDELPF